MLQIYEEKIKALENEVNCVVEKESEMLIAQFEFDLKEQVDEAQQAQHAAELRVIELERQLQIEQAGGSDEPEADLLPQRGGLSRWWNPRVLAAWLSARYDLHDEMNSWFKWKVFDVAMVSTYT